jgi:hypothetical protein
VQLASALLSKRRRGEDYFEPPAIASKPRSINDLPDEILLQILSHFGPEDLSLIIDNVCERWSILLKDKMIWKKMCYICDQYSDISHIAKVRCTACWDSRAISL